MARRLAPLCPVPLRPEALDGAADYLAAHPDALSIVGALNRLDKEARLCRGQSP